MLSLKFRPSSTTQELGAYVALLGRLVALEPDLRRRQVSRRIVVMTTYWLWPEPSGDPHPNELSKPTPGAYLFTGHDIESWCALGLVGNSNVGEDEGGPWINCCTYIFEKIRVNNQLAHEFLYVRRG